MSPLHERQPDPVVALARLSPEDLNPLLDEEVAEWKQEFDWDFVPSVDLVRKFLQAHALKGPALMRGSRVCGYAYYVCDVHRALIGDLYVAKEFRGVEAENLLLQDMLDELWAISSVDRVEAQLMMVTDPGERARPYSELMTAHPRLFLTASLSGVHQFFPRELPHLTIRPWTVGRQEETAKLIAEAYRGHPDNHFTELSRSAEGAHRFLTSIIQFPGCGQFFLPGSLAASEASSGVLEGVSLVSIVADGVGHITQVCVKPSRQGTGLGYELVRRSLAALAANGCHSVSLTVTTANRNAIRLYERMGFTKRHEFTAHVWQRGSNGDYANLEVGPLRD